MISRRGVLGEKPRVRGRVPDTPMPPATLANWVAGGLFAVCGVLAAMVVRDYPVPAAFGSLYLFCLSPFAFLVRPMHRREVAYRLLMSAVVLQGLIYLYFLYPVAAEGVTGRSPVTTRQWTASAVAAAFAYFGTWVPCIFLKIHARQAGPLLALQVLAPLAILVLSFLALGWS